ncbi:Uncharacterised protein [Mycobacterium tuberculosis]|nr:hypothetical protein RN08_2686 [Mycobacterium tuberculosis variant microti]CKM58136.1 Uncharacterised protein [Mycobacterium tuberculosis]CNE00287.1 Uncharacterised protein [Mycobacterium tuberculosis]CNG83678.1 Uncharacterised protein [Mycobacterium tuberculosis]
MSKFFVGKLSAHTRKRPAHIVTYSSIMLGTAGSVISPFTTERV